MPRVLVRRRRVRATGQRRARPGVLVDDHLPVLRPTELHWDYDGGKLSPFGAYAAEIPGFIVDRDSETPAGPVAVTFPPITNLNVVPYILELRNKETTFPDGAFQGNTFKPRGLNNPPPGFFNSLDIQWCPNQNWFQVSIAGVTYTLLSQGTAVGPCCAWCDNEKHANTAWKRVSDNGDPAKCEWKRFCSGCSECDP